MEIRQKIETRQLRLRDGTALRLDYCLLAESGPGEARLRGPYGLEIVLWSRQEVRRERCRRLTDDYREAVALIHAFAAGRVLPDAVLREEERAAVRAAAAERAVENKG